METKRYTEVCPFSIFSGDFWTAPFSLDNAADYSDEERLTTLNDQVRIAEFMLKKSYSQYLIS